jgi:hypothetical protein
MCWLGCGEKGTLIHCWWVCKLVQPLWKKIRSILYAASMHINITTQIGSSVPDSLLLPHPLPTVVPASLRSECGIIGYIATLHFSFNFIIHLKIIVHLKTKWSKPGLQRPSYLLRLVEEKDGLLIRKFIVSEMFHTCFLPN